MYSALSTVWKSALYTNVFFIIIIIIIIIINFQAVTDSGQSRGHFPTLWAAFVAIFGD